MFKDTDEGTTRFAICDIEGCPSYKENHVQNCFNRDPLTCTVKEKIDRLTKAKETIKCE